MNQLLTAQQVDAYMTLLNEKQKEFLHLKLKQKRKSKWLESLANYKGIHLEKNLTYDEIVEKIDDWELVDVLDGGPGNRPYKCECGKTLRFQYIVEHREKDLIYKLGETCFEHYTGLSPEIINDVKNHLHHIDLERDEILQKYHNRSFYDLRPAIQLKMELPSEIKEQWEVGLPLTDNQIEKVQALINIAKKKQRLEKVLSMFTEEQLKYLRTLKKTEFLEIITKKEQGQHFILENVQSLRLSEKTKKHIDLGIPLLDKQMEEVLAAEKQEELERRFKKLTSEQATWVKQFSKNEQIEILRKVESGGFIQRIEGIEGLDVCQEIYTQIQLHLPLTERQNKEISYAKFELKQQLEIAKKNAPLTFEEVMGRHLVTLRRIREKEGMIPRGLKADWEKIKSMCVDLKNGNEFNYSTFKLLINNLVIPIRVEKDKFL